MPPPLSYSGFGFVSQSLLFYTVEKKDKWTNTPKPLLLGETSEESVEILVNYYNYKTTKHGGGTIMPCGISSTISSTSGVLQKKMDGITGKKDILAQYPLHIKTSS